MPFSNAIKEKAMVACGRSCCICHKYCGNNMEVHHIKPHAEGGSDTFENAIPLCFDCHAEVGQYNSKHPKGIKFTESELVQHRDNWYSIVKMGTTKAKEPSNNQDIIITRQKDYEKIKLFCIRSGRELLNCIEGTYAIEYSHDEPASRNEAAALGHFIDVVLGLIDWVHDASPSELIMQGFDLNEEIKALDDMGFLVFCARENRKISGGVKPPAPFPILLLSICRLSNPDIIIDKENQE